MLSSSARELEVTMRLAPIMPAQQVMGPSSLCYWWVALERGLDHAQPLQAQEANLLVLIACNEQTVNLSCYLCL